MLLLADIALAVILAGWAGAFGICGLYIYEKLREWKQGIKVVEPT